MMIDDDDWDKRNREFKGDEETYKMISRKPLPKIKWVMHGKGEHVFQASKHFNL